MKHLGLAFALILMMALPLVSQAQSPTYTFGTTFQGAENYHGTIFDANARIHLNRRMTLTPGVRQLGRSYGSTHLDETTGYLGFGHVLGGGFYAVHELSATPKAEINPEWAYLGQFHYAHGANDYGLNLGYSSFKTLKSGSIGPNYYHAFTDRWAISTGLTFVNADRWLSSGMVQGIYTNGKKFEARAIYAGGETLEAAGVQARFHSLTFETMFRVAKRVRIGLGFTNYDSTRRAEDSALLRLEVH